MIQKPGETEQLGLFGSGDVKKQRSSLDSKGKVKKKTKRLKSPIASKSA